MTDTPADGLADALVLWMADNRPALDALMAEEGSRAVHEEFMLAEGGTLPDRTTRIERARGASARAWMRHLGRGLTATWADADAELAGRLERWTAAHRERLEALVLEEDAVLERRGVSGDPMADDRDAALAAHCRLFAEGLANESETLAASPESPPDFGRRLASWSRTQEAHRREIEMEAFAAWSAGTHPGSDQQMTAAPEADEMRVREAASVWAHVRVLAEALEHTLQTRPETPA